MTKKWVEPEMETLEISQTAGGSCGNGFGGHEHRPGHKPGFGKPMKPDSGFGDGFINGDFGFSE